MLAFKVPIKEIDKVRKVLMEKELMKMNYKIQTDASYGYIPLKKEYFEKIKKVKVQINSSKSIGNETIKIIEKDLEKIKHKTTSLSESLKGKLTEEEIQTLKTSFDIIGDIVILEIPEELYDQKEIIGKAALNFTKRKSIFMKKGAIEGIVRTRKLEHLAGNDSSETIHKEHGIRLSLDMDNVYFSPRLATERNRIVNQVKDGEIILDMFAGIGPFPILIAKWTNTEIYAVDINEKAIEYMEKNIGLNKLKGTIHPINEDINKIAIDFKEKNIEFNRIIMNLPGSAYEYLDLAISLLKKNGILHYYEFNDNYQTGINRISSIAAKYKKKIKIINTRKVKSSSPGKWHIAIDAEIY